MREIVLLEVRSTAGQITLTFLFCRLGSFATDPKKTILSRAFVTNRMDDRPRNTQISSVAAEFPLRKLSSKRDLLASSGFGIGSQPTPPAGVSLRLLNGYCFRGCGTWFRFPTAPNSCKMRFIASSNLDFACQNRATNSFCRLYSASIFGLQALLSPAGREFAPHKSATSCCSKPKSRSSCRFVSSTS
jgi:hypothetical protein